MKFSVSVTFFCDGTGRTDRRTDKQTDGWTDIGTDRLLSENIILEEAINGNKLKEPKIENKLMLL